MEQACFENQVLPIFHRTAKATPEYTNDGYCSNLHNTTKRARLEITENIQVDLPISKIQDIQTKFSHSRYILLSWSQKSPFD